MRPGRLPVLLLCGALAACEHARPFQPVTPGDVGPFGTTLPRRLTFYPLASRTPSVADGMLFFARQSAAEPGSYGPNGREECISVMRVDGGTIARSLCPDKLLARPDTLVDTWYEPSLSPDGQRIAFMWQRGYRVSALGFNDAYLMVTSLDHPTDTTGVRHPVQWLRPVLPNPVHATVATRITWLDLDRLRFIATYEHIRKVKGGGAERVTDTTWDPLALMDLDVRTGVASLVPGGDSVTAYTTAPDGGLWIVKDSDSAAVLHLDPATGTIIPFGRFSAPVQDLIVVMGAPLAIVAPGDSVERIDPVTLAVQAIGGFTGPARRLAAAGGKRFIVEMQQATGVLFGAPPALWLYEWP